MSNGESQRTQQHQAVCSDEFSDISDKLLLLQQTLDSQRSEAKENKEFIAFAVAVCLVLVMSGIVVMTLIVAFGRAHML